MQNDWKYSGGDMLTIGLSTLASWKMPKPFGGKTNMFDNTASKIMRESLENTYYKNTSDAIKSIGGNVAKVLTSKEAQDTYANKLFASIVGGLFS